MRRWIVFVCIALISSLAFAQSEPIAEPSAFLRALSNVPDNEVVRDSGILFTYADYHAAIQAHGYPIPESWAAFTNEGGFPVLVFPSGGPVDLLQTLFRGGERYPELLGFDFFQVEQSLEFGTPPVMGRVLLGESLSPLATALAYSARDYQVITRDSGTLLCPPDGCDAGTKVSIQDRNPENPFGGNLGRKELAYVADGVFLNSPGEETMTAMLGVVESDEPSLADAVEFQAVSHVLAAYPFVSTVWAVDPLVLGTNDPLQILEGATIPEGADAVLPFYFAAVFASVADADNEYALALLVYGDAETAQVAAAAVDARMALTSTAVNKTYAEIFSMVGTLEPARVVTDEATGMSVVVLRITTPLPTESPHVGLSRLTTGIIRRDTQWLIWSAE